MLSSLGDWQGDKLKCMNHPPHPSTGRSFNTRQSLSPLCLLTSDSSRGKLLVCLPITHLTDNEIRSTKAGHFKCACLRYRERERQRQGWEVGEGGDIQGRKKGGKETGSEKRGRTTQGKENCLPLTQASRAISESWPSRPPGTHLGSAEDSMTRTQPGTRLACLVCAALTRGLFG